jgi:adenylate cyclase
MAAAALGATAYVNLTADEDDFIRSIELVEPGTGSQPRMQSMALAMAEKYMGRPVHYPSRLITIRYAGPAGTIRRVSLVDFLQAARAGKTELLRSWVAGKAVLLGADDLADRYATPYYAFRAGSPANTMGVEIHASALNTLLSGRFLQKASLPVSLALMFLVALCASIATMLSAGWRLIAWHAALVGSVVLGAHVAFRAGWLVPVFSLLAAAALAFLLSLVARALTVARNRNSLRRAIRLFVGEEVAEAVEATGSVGLTGRREFVTVLFSDIRGFTAFSETHEPEIVVERLNEYLSAMTALIVRHGGEVNKFVGDGVLAVFSGADSAGESHASRAVRCAMDMVATPLPFETRTGIHTGYVIVGNIGSSDKLEYTVLGDTVNLASRLEGLNKEFSTNILFGTATCELLDPGVMVRRLGEVNVKGKSAPVALYTVARGSAE